MIVIALGANLPSARYGTPRDTLEAALDGLAEEGITVVRRSRWYASRPVPEADQPDYVNGVAVVASALDPAALLAALHRIEARFGRVRGAPNAARTLDLDLIDYDGRVSSGGSLLELPHPRAHLRSFVLMPIADAAPGWRHPLLGLSAAELLMRLGPDPARTHPL